jgi:hypothetical protein
MHAIAQLQIAEIERAGRLEGATLSLVHAEPTESAYERVMRASFPARREAPGQARRMLARMLRARGCELAVVEIAELVLSELASNAVRHVGGPFSVEAPISTSTLRVAVEDTSPHLLDGAIAVIPTHGLAVVDSLALRWGRERAAAGKLVWAEISL